MSLNDHADVVTFVDDEAGYLSWLESNPAGFVVNAYRKPTASYVVVHRAVFRHMNSESQTNYTKDYSKACSNDINQLLNWVRDRVGTHPRPCGACKPSVSEWSDRQIVRPVVPVEIDTGCPQLDLAWKTYAQFVLESPILIPDTEEDLNWHAFLGHAFDMQGFRAAEFVGVYALTREAEGFVPLKQLGIGIAQLGALWEIEPIQRQLLSRPTGEPLASTFAALAEHGSETGEKLADAFIKFRRCRYASTVRALLQNCAVLKPHGYSFRSWLIAECEQLGVSEFPPSDFKTSTGFKDLSVEMALGRRLQETFYQVGPALAPYMLCDWQLWLWNEGRTAVFYNFKLDSFHQEFVERFGGGRIPADEAGFTKWWSSLYPDLPPRLANECIWLGMENGLFG